MKFKIHPAHRNLGCLGFTIGAWYCDFFRTPYFGWYSNTAFGKVWIRLFPRPRLLKREWVAGGKYHHLHYTHKGYIRL
jgi:hypothetical protein